MNEYFHQFAQSFGNGWNRFWYAPTDALTLCVVRILVGGLVLYTLATYTPDLVEAFGADGLLTPKLVEEYRGTPAFAWSYLDYLREPTELRVVHGLGLIVAALFTVGLFTRITAVLTLVVFLSYLHRAPMLTSEFEPMLALPLFYLCLGPCGTYLSVDTWLRKRRGNLVPPQPSWTVTVASRLLQVHFAVLMLLAALAKLRGEVWWTGEAVWWLVAKPESRLVDLTGSLAGHPYVYNAWSYAIVLYELCFPVFIWNRFARPLLIMAGAILWPLLALITGLCSFAAAMLAVTCIFISPEALRATLARFGLRV